MNNNTEVNINNLPMEIKNNKIETFKKHFPQKFAEVTKKVGRCAFWGGVTLAGLGAFAVSNPLVAILGLNAMIIGTNNLQRNIRFRKFPGLMFAARKSFFKKATVIEQLNNEKTKSQMKDMNKLEKGSLMALQTLIGFERYKRELEGSMKEPSEKDGICLYPKKFATVTHGINIKNLKALEQLGYIKIDTDLVNSPKKESQLIRERLGFGQGDVVKDIIKAKIRGDKEALDKTKVEMQEVEFRLTDKHIDFNELYRMCNDRSEDNIYRTPARRLVPIFSKTNGLLKTQNIDIQDDKDGMPVIIYKSRESFAQRMLKEDKRKEDEKSFTDSLTEWKQNPEYTKQQNMKYQYEEHDFKMENRAEHESKGSDSEREIQ